MTDIIVTIEQYVPTDTYTVHVYNGSSLVPINTKQVAAGTGPVVIVDSVPSGLSYDVEVIQHFSNGTSSRKRVSVGLQDSSFSCPNGFKPNEDGKACRRIAITVALHYNSTNSAVTDFTTIDGQGGLGAKVYAPGFNLDGTGGIEWYDADNTVWIGRMQFISRWLIEEGAQTWAVGKWVGYSKVLEIAESKVYYVGVCAENAARINVNGNVIVDQSLGDNDYNRSYFHIYPVYLFKGINIIEVQAKMLLTEGAFGVDIYDTGVEQIKVVSDPETLSGMTVLFSSKDQAEVVIDYTCQDGYVLDKTGDVPLCKRIDYYANL